MDSVKVTIIGVPRADRQRLKVACLRADTSISAELRARLPRIIDEIEGEALTYGQLVRLLMSMIGVVNLALAERAYEAQRAMDEIGPELRRFRAQISRLRRPHDDHA